MKQEQWNKFLDKKIIKPGARVSAQVRTYGIGGDQISVMKELSVINVNRGGGIDSMTPERLAKAYNIK